jgi:hypothetical protein
MTSNTEPKTMAHRAGAEPDLLRQTLRTVGVLVAVCVLFVGGLSVLAVAITSRAVSAGASGTSAGTHARDARDATETAKKPLSI